MEDSPHGFPFVYRYSSPKTQRSNWILDSGRAITYSFQLFLVIKWKIS
jgi:hypothetical protein